MIVREQYQDLLAKVVESEMPVVIHVPGGVGKTSFATYAKNALPNGSIAIVYDCFGAGSYRNSSSIRHRPREAFVQIVNELAVEGLCDPLINREDDTHDLMRMLRRHLSVAIKKLKEENPMQNCLF